MFWALQEYLMGRPYIQLKGGPSLTALGITYLDQHGLNPTLVGVWQQVTIPTAFFTANVAIADIRAIELFLVKSTATPNTYVNIVQTIADNPVKINSVTGNDEACKSISKVVNILF